MKKLVTLILVSLFSICANAQQDTLWRKGGLLSLNFTQVALKNWAGGGQNSISGNSLVNLFANYSKGKNSWDNTLDLSYGFINQGRHGQTIKNDDRIDFSSKYGRKASAHWNYATLINFRSQFTAGYNYPDDSTVISKFLAPGYVVLSTGFDYKPSSHFSLFLSAVTGRLIIVNDTLLSNAGAYGVDTGKTVKGQFGSFLKASLNTDIVEHVNLQTTLDLFSNYLEKPQNIVVNWQILLTLKVNKFINATITSQLIYDDNVLISLFDEDGVLQGTGKRMQLKEVLGIGFSYKFEGVSVRKK